jgi:uncharacterized protein DUF1571
MKKILTSSALFVFFVAVSLEGVQSLSADDSPSNASDMTNLARNDPLAFLQNCLKQYEKNVRGYQVTMQKQERLQGRLQNREVIEVAFREQPFSVFMRWLEGAKKADRVVFVAGENEGMMLAHPSGVAGKLVKVVKRKVDSEEARQSGRYTVDQFGFKNSLQRILSSLETAKQKGALHLEFQGETKVFESDQRICFKLKRTYAAPEADGTEDLTLYVDRENFLPIGIVVRGKVDAATGNRELLGEYFFRDLRLNPQFSPQQFNEAAFN